MSLLKQLTDNGYWCPINEAMCREHGLMFTLILAKHIQYHEYYSNKHGNEYNGYYGVRSLIEETFTVTSRRQKEYEDEFIELGLMERARVGQRQKIMFILNENKLTEFIENQRESQVYSETPIGRNRDSVEDGTDKKPTLSGNFANCGTEQFAHSNIKERVSKETHQNASVQDNGGTEKPSRPKLNFAGKDDSIATPSGTKSLTDKLNGRAPIIVPKKAMAIIEYWNSFPELATLKVTPNDPTLKLKYTIQAIADFFSGEFLKRAMVPPRFKDHKWFDQDLTVDDFKDLVDDFVYCVRQPKILPQYNGHKPDLQTFISGNQWVNKEGALPSLMLLYCFGDYQTLQEDKYPKTTELIKKHWEKYVGKYADTPDAESAFVAISSLAHFRYKQKREEEDGWIPAMNDYKADGILRQILAKQSEFLKGKKKHPDFMATNHFMNMVRRYDYNKKTGDITF